MKNSNSTYNNKERSYPIPIPKQTHDPTIIKISSSGNSEKKSNGPGLTPESLKKAIDEKSSHKKANEDHQQEVKSKEDDRFFEEYYFTPIEENNYENDELEMLFYLEEEPPKIVGGIES